MRGIGNVVGVGVTFKRNAKAEQQLDATLARAFDELTNLAFESIVNGSPELTGSPGQPEDLRKPGVWTITKLNERENVISTVEPSAKSVEDGIKYRSGGGPITKLKSSIGGFDSVKKTQQHADNLVGEAIKRARGKS